MAEPRAKTLSIKTPEGIVFSQTLAGPASRFLAWAIDQVVILVSALLFFTLPVLIAPVASLLGTWLIDWLVAAVITGYFIVSYAYNIALEYLWRGQTLGKWMLGLRVMDEQGLRLQFTQVAIRNVMRLVDQLPPPALYLVGGLACLASKRAQRLGDFAANTVVVRVPKITQPDLDQVLTGKYNSLRDYPHLEARLRQVVSPDEARIALEALMRRNELDPQSRVELFAEFAAHFRGLVAFPEEAAYGVPDEQYVRNVVEVIFRPRTTFERSADKSPEQAATRGPRVAQRPEAV